MPPDIVTNADLKRRGVDTDDEWIRRRTGIRQRHIARPDEFTSHLATHAAKAALANAKLAAEAVDAIILATTTPDRTFPATATAVQAQLGISRGFAFDIQAVCAGYIYALAVADNFIRLGQAKTVLVIGAEVFSRLLDWQDRTTCVLFGDGAAALLLQGVKASGTVEDRGILSTHLFSDGRLGDLLYVDSGPGSGDHVGKVRMEGKEVFRHAVQKMGHAMEIALKSHHLTTRDIDWLIPHQANQRIIEALGESYAIPPEKVVVTVDRHANTSAASVPLAICHAEAARQLKPGQLILLNALGGGFAWGAALLRW